MKKSIQEAVRRNEAMYRAGLDDIRDRLEREGFALEAHSQALLLEYWKNRRTEELVHLILLPERKNGSAI